MRHSDRSRGPAREASLLTRRARAVAAVRTNFDANTIEAYEQYTTFLQFLHSVAAHSDQLATI